MSKKKLDESSVAAMINGFLAGKKKAVSENKKKAVKKKGEAFWNSIAESLMLEGPGREDPDDWMQTFDFTRGGALKDLEQGGFTADNGDPDVPKAPKEVDRTRGKDITELVSRRLRAIRDRDPKKWAEFQALDQKGKTSFKLKLLDQIKKQQALRQNAAGHGKGGSAKNREEVVGALVKKVLAKIVDLTKNGQEIPENLSILSRKYLGFDAKKDTSRVLLSKLAQQPNIPDDVISGFTKRALEKGDSSEVLKFARTHLDMYPGNFQDKAEDFANKQNLPGAGEDKSRGIGGSKRIIGGDDENLKDKVVQRARTGLTPVGRMFHDYPIEDILAHYDYYTQNPEEMQRAREERIGPAITGLTDITGDLPSVDSKARLRNEKPPASVDQGILSGREKKVARQARPDPTDVTYGSKLDLDPKDVLRRVSDFGGDNAPDPAENSVLDKLARGLANTFNAKSDRISGPADEFTNRTGGLKSELAQLAEPIRALAARQDQLSPQEEAKLSQLTAEFKKKRQELEELKNRPPVHEHDIIDIIRKLSKRDATGNLVSLQDPSKVGFDDPVEYELAHRIFARLNPQRLNQKGGDVGQDNPYNLKRFIPGFVADEEEKAADGRFITKTDPETGEDKEVWLPAAKEMRDREARNQKARKAAQAAELNAIKTAPKKSPEEIAAIKQADQSARTNVHKAMAKRRQDLDFEKDDLDTQISSITGDGDQFARIQKRIDDIAKLPSKQHPLNFHDPITIGTDDGPKDMKPLDALKQAQDSRDDMMAMRDPERIDASLRGKNAAVGRQQVSPERKGQVEQQVAELQKSLELRKKLIIRAVGEMKKAGPEHQAEFMQKIANLEKSAKQIEAQIRGKQNFANRTEMPAERQAELGQDMEKLKKIRPLAVRRKDLANLPSMQNIFMGDLGARMSAKEKETPRDGKQIHSLGNKVDKAEEKPFDLPSGNMHVSYRKKNKSHGSGAMPASIERDERPDAERQPGREFKGKVHDTDVGGVYRHLDPEELPTPKRFATHDQPTNLKKGDKRDPKAAGKMGDVTKIDLPDPTKIAPPADPETPRVRGKKAIGKGQSIDVDEPAVSHRALQPSPLPNRKRQDEKNIQKGHSIDPRTKKGDKKGPGLPDELASGDASFKYGKEGPEAVNKKLVQKLVQHAREQVHSLGQEITPENIMQYIIDGFTPDEEGETVFPQRYNAVKDFLMNKGKQLLGKHGLPRDLKVEGVTMKRSILELLTDIGSEENKHAKAKEEKQGWDRATPEKKMNMVPKWKKSKMTLKELFKEED